MRLYSVYDKVAKEHGPVFEAKNDDVALRNLRQMMHKNPSFKHDEFDLFFHGQFDNEAGVITAASPEPVRGPSPKTVLPFKPKGAN